MMAANVASSVVQPLFGYWSDKEAKAFLLPLGCVVAGVGLSLVPLTFHYSLVLVSSGDKWAWRGVVSS